MNPARMFLESLDRRPGIREQPGSIADIVALPALAPLYPPEADIGVIEQQDCSIVGLDFCCERSVAGEAGDAVAAS